MSHYFWKGKGTTLQKTKPQLQHFWGKRIIRPVGLKGPIILSREKGDPLPSYNKTYFIMFLRCPTFWLGIVSELLCALVGACAEQMASFTVRFGQLRSKGVGENRDRTALTLQSGRFCLVFRAKKRWKIKLKFLHTPCLFHQISYPHCYGEGDHLNGFGAHSHQ